MVAPTQATSLPWPPCAVEAHASIGRACPGLGSSFSSARPGRTGLWGREPEGSPEPLAASDPPPTPAHRYLRAVLRRRPPRSGFAVLGQLSRSRTSRLPGRAPETPRVRARFVEQPSVGSRSPATTPPRCRRPLRGSRAERCTRATTIRSSGRPGWFAPAPNIRQAASRPDVLRTLPHDAVLVTLYGTFEGQSSSPGVGTPR